MWTDADRDESVILEILVTEPTASVHFSYQPKTCLRMRPLTIAHKECSRQAEKWTSVVHKKC